MRFLTRYDSKSPKPSASGSREYREAKVVFSPDGNLTLEYAKQTRDRQNEINSYAAGCDVNMLVKRYENGDQMALLRSNTGVYADLSQMPKSIHEAQELSRSIHSLYDSMGDDIKSRYGTLDEFCSAFSTKANFDEFVGFSRECVKKRTESIKKLKQKEGEVNA